MPNIGNFETLGDYVKHHRDKMEKGEEPSDEAASEVPSSGHPLFLEDFSDAAFAPLQVQQFGHAAPLSLMPSADPETVTDLHTAVLQRDVKKIRLVVAGPHARRNVPVDAPNEEGETALLIAAREGLLESCAALLDCGADPLVRDNHPHCFGDGIWPDEGVPDLVGKAVAKNHASKTPGRTVIFLLRLHHILDKVLDAVFPMTRLRILRDAVSAIQAWHGMSALIVAAKRGNAELLALLLAHRAGLPHCRIQDVDGPMFMQAPTVVPPIPSACERGQALLQACSHHNWPCAEVLLASNVPRASINACRDKLGRYSIHLAAVAGEVPVVRILLRAGASTTVVSDTGRQPLHEACAAGHVGAVKALLHAGADPTAIVKEPKPFMHRSEDSGRTARDLAQYRGHMHVIAAVDEYCA